MKSIYSLILPALMLLGLAAGCGSSAAKADPQPQYVTVRDGNFYIGDSIYRYIGTNFWYGPILASEGRGGDRGRLARELDSLKALGLTNLRILAGADGREGLHSHVSPVMHTAPGEYNDTLLRGLDYLLAELEKRDMKAVLYLNNAWEWSGGYGTYLEWTGHGPAPLPNVDGYQAYVDYVKQFVLNDSARALSLENTRRLVGRTNTVTGKPYSESPAIMSWQVCNEPRAFSKEGKEALLTWIQETGRAIKEIDPNHLVSTGSEGKYGCEVDLDLWTRIHSLPEVDYATIHIWPRNWNWHRRGYAVEDLDTAIAYTKSYIDEHVAAIAPAKRPLVIEEFGYARDAEDFKIGSPITARDRYYDFMFSTVSQGKDIAGLNFWGWGGTAVPLHDTWEQGDPYTGDPAQEPQGLFSVFTADKSTIDLIRKHNKK